MDAIKALHERISCPRLSAPAPVGEVLLNIQKAAFRAADHGRMRPWRFLVVEGDGLSAMGELFARAETLKNPELSEKERQRAVGRPMRAPMVIVAIASPKANLKVPEIEQVISTGAAVQNMITAAYAQNVGAIWRTGDYAYDRAVMDGLGLSEDEKIVGFLYLGTMDFTPPPAPQAEVSEYFTSWP
ncbi:MAG: nitroreductase [Gammaproteobacteria bacterium]|nr:MAG: nitroreductase [Gammaproteobacteria bacterium]